MRVNIEHIVELKEQLKAFNELKLEDVELFEDGKKIEIGQPYIKNAKIEFKVLADTKGKKVVSYKYKRRKSSRTKIGHRQKFTKLKIEDIKLS